MIKHKGFEKLSKKKGVLYTRVSSDPQEEQGFSIPAQEKYGREFATKENIEIVEVFSESRTAKEAGRLEFNNMLKFLKKHKDVEHVIVEQTNRLLRNEFDSALIIQLATTTNLTFHILKDHLTLNRNSPPMDFFMFTMNTAISAIYPRNLSIDVKKGMNEKAEEGFYPGRAPVGYTNCRESKKKSILIVDEKKAEYVKQAFRLYDSGLFSFETLANKLSEDGFYPYKNLCNKSNIEDILKNPIYMGEFNYNGRRYKGVHEPLISKELYCSVQKRITGEGSPRKTKHEHLYKCFIKCAYSGCMLSGETKKGANNSGEYTYYRCTHKNGCKQACKPLKASYVDEFVEDTIKKLIPTQEQINFLINRIKEIHKSKNQYDENAIETIQKEILTLKKRINNAYNDKLDGVITQEFYFEKEKAWQRDIDEKEVRLKNVMSSDSTFVTKAEQLLELCKNAYMWYYSQDCENKRSFLKLICSNFFYDGSNLTMATKNTFKTMLESDIFVNGGR